DNGIAVYCHKCQGNTDFLAAIGWTEADLFDTPLERSRDRPADDSWIPCQRHGHKRVAQYVYCDENGGVVHGVTRCDHKDFAQWRPDPATRSGRRWSLNGERGNRLVPFVPYRLPELLAAKEADRVIFIAEGEKDVHALVEHGLAATCNAGGSGKWTADHARYLAGADVTIVADRDEKGQEHALAVGEALRRRARPVYAAHAKRARGADDHFDADRDEKGQEHALAVVESLRGLAHSVYVVQAKRGKDAADHFAAGHKDHEFVQVWAPIPYPGDPAVTA